ncbi:MAG: trehalose utilization protein ThuA [Candidatus Omnitrophota bacterium]|jgi:trehalose utilization protein|nr:MAG: trehalose utilization protein ThuA [Candidatus Omnitrophota bacterium]
MNSDRPHVLVWSEWTEPPSVYPIGIHGEIARFLEHGGFHASTSYPDDQEQGLAEERLLACDVLIWFGHSLHETITDEHAERVVRHVRERGMGFIPLHSSHLCKPFRMLMDTSCTFPTWREDAGSERIAISSPDHPIARGVNDFTLPQTEMYSEPFDVPPPETVVLHSTWESGESFRSGCCWTRGKGRIFYFRPGHETYPIFFDDTVRKILLNSIVWASRRED